MLDGPPSALLVTGDQVAAGIITFFQRKGLIIPGDLAIISFYNQPIAKMMDLTTIEIPLEEIGRKLFQQAINNELIAHQEIAVQLIQRSTVQLPL